MRKSRYGLSRASLYAPPDLPHIENWVETNVNPHDKKDKEENLKNQ